MSLRKRMKMKRYRVCATEESEWVWPIIEAQDEDEAQDIANEDWVRAKQVYCEVIEMNVEEMDEDETL